ncbi:MAG: tetratricopeptide repeat protein [Flavobacteriaceae bacterium]
MRNQINNYVFKAIDSFHYDLEETMEALNYALSYNDKDIIALTLMGRVYAEKLSDYNEAITYYKQALAEKVDGLDVQSYYINALLWNEDYKEAEEFIDFALTVKGSDKAELYLNKASLFEELKDYKKALSFIKLAKEHTYNNEFMDKVKEQKKRVVGKMPKKKKKKNMKKKKIKS